MAKETRKTEIEVSMKRSVLEAQYAELIRLARQNVTLSGTQVITLSQHSLLRVVPTVTTYGAYQTPV